MTTRKQYFFRSMAILAIFCLICVIYLGRLFFIQISGRENEFDTGTSTRKVTVQAVRGEIYDRNGHALVTNRYTYDLTLQYASLASSGIRQSNYTCLSALSALDANDEAQKHVEKFFPFEGAYPYYTFSSAAHDPDSIVCYRLQKVLNTVGIDTDADEKKIADYYVKTYDLLATDANGNRLFDDDQIDRLIRLRYDMDAVGFKSSGEYTLAEDVSLGVITHVKESALVGATFRVNAERVYNYPGYASHILGTIGPIYSEEWDYYNEQGYQMNAVVGKSGCEFAFEQYLRGSDGQLLIEEDSAGNVVNVTVLKAPVAGNDVYLTIDIDLQIAAEDGLRENVEYVVNRPATAGDSCQSGAAVVMDPNTFDILAIASYPSYDLGLYHEDYDTLAKDPANPLFNRALAGLYAPGSTFKPGVAVAALLEGVTTAQEQIVCTGSYNRYSPSINCVPHDFYTQVDIREAVAHSCNSFFCEIGYRMGIEKMNEYMAQFGFGASTGIELGSKTGVLASPAYRLQTHGAPWTEGLTLQAAIGQSDNLASPLQLACYISTLVGGGSRYSAHLLDSVYAFGSDSPSYVYESSDDTLLGSITIPPYILSAVKDGMKDVIPANATLSSFFSDIPVTVIGKTGTAQTGATDDNALFVCAAPYDNPEIVISVVLEQGANGYYAGYTADHILEKYYGVE